jgi:hypothetical protein
MLLEEQRGLDQLKLHHDGCSVIARRYIDTRIEQIMRNRGKRRLPY